MHSYLRHVSDPDSLGYELWHASGLPIPNWLLWVSRTRNGWCNYCRYVPTSKASLRLGNLGYRSSLRARLGAFDRRICRHVKRLDVDNLGAYVALRCLLGVLVLLPPGDKLAKHPSSQDQEAEETYRRR